jgi:TfoX/Sxy family transcriptional regulator of competence genes
MAYDEETAARVRKALSRQGGVVEKKMMGGLCFMVKGAMSCTVSGRGGMLIRIRPEVQEPMLREPYVQPMEMGARTMKGFVRVMPEGYRTDAALAQWVQRGLDAVAALPAKPVRGKARQSRKPPRPPVSRKKRAQTR